MDTDFFFSAMSAVGITPIVIDEETEMSEQETVMSRLSDAYEIAKSAVTNEFSLRSKLGSIESQLASLNDEVARLKFDNQGFEEAIKMRDAAIVEARQQRNDAMSNASATKFENSTLRQQVAELQARNANWQHVFDEVVAERDTARHNLEDATRDYDLLTKEHDEVKAKLHKVQDALGMSVAEHDMSEDNLVPLSEGTPEPQVMETHEPSASADEPVREIGADNQASSDTKSEGELWPSMNQPRDENTGWFKPYEKKSEVN